MNSHTRHLGQVEFGGLEVPGSEESPRRKGLLRFAVLRFRGTIAIGMFIGAVLGFLYGAGQPNTYEAAGKMLFQTGMREAANAELVVGESVSASRTDAQSIATEMQILESPEIYQRVLETVGVERLIATPDPRRVDTESTPLPVVLLHEFQAWLLGMGQGDEAGRPRVSTSAVLSGLQRALRPDALTPSSVIEVSFVAADPVVARDVVNAYLEAAESHHRKVFSSKERLELSRSEEQTARREVDEAVNALEEFNQKNGIYDLAAQRTALVVRINEQERLIQDARTQMRQLEVQTAYLKLAIAVVQKEPALLDSAQPNPDYTRIQTSLSALVLRKLDMERRVAETAEQFAARQKTLDERIAILEQEVAKTSPTAMQPNFARAERLAALQGKLVDAEGSAAGLDKVVEGRTTQLEGLRKRLQALNESGPRSEALAAEVTRRRLVAQNLAERRERLEMMGLLDDQRLGNLKTVEAAVTPLAKLGPARGKFLLFGCVLGACAGLSIALWRSLTDPLLRRPGELAQFGGEPVLAVVPKSKVVVDLAGIVAGSAGEESHVPALIHEMRENFAGGQGVSRPHRVAFVGGGVDVGCSMVTLAAARGLVESGARVLVVGGERLVEDLGSETSSPTRNEVVATVEPRLSVMAVDGVVAPAHALDRVVAEFDYVLLDVGDFETNPAFSAQLTSAHSHVLVVAGGRLTRHQVEKRLRTVKRVGGEYRGAVFTSYDSSYPRWLPGQDPELQAT